MKISKDIVVFDGVCALCNGVFKWLIENDKQEQFMYTNFQSNYSKENNLRLNDINSVAVIKLNGEWYLCNDGTITKLDNIENYLNYGYIYLYVKQK